mgnify:CR=1 FL=1
MAQPVIMPKLGQTVEEATILKWHKKVGDTIKKGDVLFEIETDKAVLEVESFFEGTLLHIAVKEGETVPVTSTVAFIGMSGESIPSIVPVPKPVLPEPVTPPVPSTLPAPSAIISVDKEIPPAIAPQQPSKQLSRKTFSPRARRLIKESVISAGPIPGTGPSGRVIEKDVIAYLNSKHYSSIRITPAAKVLAAKEGIDLLSVESPDNRITIDAIRQAIAEKPKAMSKTRQLIAQRMTSSFTTVPHFFVTVSVDMTNLLSFKKTLKKDKKQYSVTDFLLKAVALALVEFPAVNSTTDGTTIRWHSRIHLGVGVAVKDGLVVPVIRNCQKLSLLNLHQNSLDLVSRARNGKLVPDEMHGSTFTISNMGMLDVENFTAIINPGESAILAVSSILKKPVVINNTILIRSMMKITLSSDHRAVDGAMAAKFVNRIKTLLEDIEPWKNLT